MHQIKRTTSAPMIFRRPYRGAWVFGFFLVVQITQVCAGAWTQEKNHALIIYKYNFYETDMLFDTAGTGVPLGTDGQFRKQNLANMYTEYGITNRLTAVGNFFYDRLRYTDKFSNFRNAGFSDHELGLRYLVIKAPVIFSVQETVKIPTGYDRRMDLPLGNGQVDTETNLLAGKELRPFYFNGELGYRLRSKEPPDEIRWQALVGFKGIKDWEIYFGWNAIRSIGAGHPVSIGKNILSTISFDLDRMDVGANRKLSRYFALEGGYFQHVAGRNTGAGKGVTVGCRLFIVPAH